MSNVQFINLAETAVIENPVRGAEPPWTSKTPGSNFGAVNIATNDDGIAVEPFVAYSEEFLHVLGEEPVLKLIGQEQSYPFAHEAGVWIPSTREVFFTSNQFFESPSDSRKKINILKISIPKSKEAPMNEYKLEVIKPTPDIVSGNGGTSYKNGALFCQQGAGDIPAALVYMDVHPPYNSKVLLNHFHGRPFNAVNDVVELPLDGTLWFTDPTYGIIQGLRDYKRLPNQVYSFNPATGDICVVADGIHMPNGIAFSHDWKVCYITDTHTYDGRGSIVNENVATIYAYDVVKSHKSAQSTGRHILLNKRVFAFADCGAPDGIKVDLDGNVYSGCKDGVQVWNSDGILIGKILVPGGVANFCFTDPGRMILFNENRIFEAQVKARGALVR